MRRLGHGVGVASVGEAREQGVVRAANESTRSVRGRGCVGGAGERGVTRGIE